MSADLILTIFSIVVLLYSVVLHELAHGLMARSMGDKTAEQAGRLTLNPIPHLDWFGSVLLPFFLFMVHSPFVFGYAKPVPYNPDALNDRAYGPAKVAIMGPAVNFVLAVLFGISIRIFYPVGALILQNPPILLRMLAVIVSTNLVLAIFNLLPIPPLDGHWLLMTFLPARFHAFKVALYRYQWFVLIFVLFFVFPALMPLLGWVSRLLTGYQLF